MVRILLGLLLGFGVSVLLCPLIINIVKKMRIKQTILKYVDAHKSKQGTPTMGGIAFLLAITMVSLLLIRWDTYWIMGLAVGICYGLIGFLDDYIKVRLNQNLGLRAYQKIIGQTGIAIILAIYVYFFSGNGGNIVIPFVMVTFDIGWWIIPIIILFCLAMTNSVNLLDGLDGLASNVSVYFFVSLILVLVLFQNTANAVIYDDIIVLSAIIVGALLAFLAFNTFKASIFMGDVGSLALGGFASSIVSLSGMYLIVPIIGIVFVMTTLSVIIQVISYKTRKKRVFLMSPIHHHFQMKGHSEAKIVYIYSLITIISTIIYMIVCLMI